MEPLVPTTVQVAQIRVLSQKAIQLWEEAVWTVKEAQEKFIKAYRATLTEVAGKDWHQTWRTNPHFASLLADVESEIREICCGKHKMKLTTFNRYRNAARKTVLLGVPFDLSKRLTLGQIQAIEVQTKDVSGEDKEKSVREIVKEICKQRHIDSAAAVVSKVATVLPLPAEEEPSEDYLAVLKAKLQSHLELVKERFGDAVVVQICSEVVQLVTAPGDIDSTELPA